MKFKFWEANVWKLQLHTPTDRSNSWSHGQSANMYYALNVNVVSWVRISIFPNQEGNTGLNQDPADYAFRCGCNQFIPSPKSLLKKMAPLFFFKFLHTKKINQYFNIFPLRIYCFHSENLNQSRTSFFN